ncbi:MAG: transglycosylase domain-containing protein [Bacteroidales bacterium]|nr:transglycosylase domain-containing protein [Bacteroidales bacterium]
MSDTNKDSNKNNQEKKSLFEESGYGSMQPSERTDENSNSYATGSEPVERSSGVNTFSPDDEMSKIDIIEENARVRHKQRKYIIALWAGVFIILTGVVVMFIGISLGWFGFMPSFEELENPQTFLASEIVSHDNQLLGTYYIENRSKSHFAEISPNLISALIATEDVRFRKHSGIDIKALGRVLFGALSGQDKGGGSTITQQLAKNLFPREYNQNAIELAFRKFKEWVIAVKLEKRYSKDEIITMYLDKFDFLNLAVGINSAARVYFNTTPAELDILQSALLVGMVKNPSLFNPLRRPELAMQRRNTVLLQMVKYGYLNEQQADTLLDKPLGLNFQRVDHNIGSATYFKEFLRGQMKKWCSTHFKPDGTPYDLYRDGLRIYTTIDSRMQKYAEAAVSEHLGLDLQPAFYAHWKGHKYAPFVFEADTIKEQVENIMNQAMRRSDRYQRLKQNGVEYDSIVKVFNTPVEMTLFSWKGDIDTIMTPMDSIRYFKFFLNAGLMSVDPPSGEVRAYVGGIDYRFFKYDHVTQSRRQVGSTFKPFLYTLAMQEGAATGQFSPCSKLPNVQVSIELPDGTYWNPRNSGNEKEGELVTLKWALAHSVNWISAYLMKRFSPLAVIQMAKKMGITTDIPAVPAIALGTPDISLDEMVGAVNTYANRGIHIKPFFVTKIEDKFGNVIESFAPESNEAMDEQTAYLMLNLMQGVVETGTGIRLKYKYGFRNEIAGKTGTTQNQSDGWFMGITPQLTSGIWVGCEDRSAHFRSITLGQGANMALPIWALYMQKVYADTSLHISMDPFPKPSKPLNVEIDCEKFDQQRLQEDYFIDPDDF